MLFFLWLLVRFFDFTFSLVEIFLDLYIFFSWFDLILTAGSEPPAANSCFSSLRLGSLHVEDVIPEVIVCLFLVLIHAF